MKLHEKIIISGQLELLTGLHIGDSKENTDIGGLDSPVVRRRDNNQPYIPGSSLKGKMRSLLEIAEGSNARSKFRRSDYAKESLIPSLFGSAGDDGGPSRILVRDAALTEESARLLSESTLTDLPYTEVKVENVIDRLEGTAKHPRQIERVPPGATFSVEFVINIITSDADEIEAERLKAGYLTLFKKGIELLEADYLGGSGSRGYGKVCFRLEEPDSLRIG
jgi:CRISPR-associated protein Csm3